MPPHRSLHSPVTAPFPYLLEGDGLAKRDLGKLQPMREALQQLRQEGLIGVHLL
jgi:hypothetical protein